MTTEEKISELNSIALMMSPHPENNKDSEFNDRLNGLCRVIESMQKELNEDRTREVQDKAELLTFGDYVVIEQKRHGSKNEMFLHKVIGRSQSNCFVDIPVVPAPLETRHDDVFDVISCICCGVSETVVRKYKLSDVIPNTTFRV